VVLSQDGDGPEARSGLWFVLQVQGHSSSFPIAGLSLLTTSLTSSVIQFSLHKNKALNKKPYVFLNSFASIPLNLIQVYFLIYHLMAKWGFWGYFDSCNPKKSCP
jgi:hypothetical protein